MRKGVLVAWVVLVMGLVALAGCKGQDCYEPTPAEEVREGVLEEVDEGLDVMKATPKQREAVRAQAGVLIGRMLTLRAERAPHKAALLDELQKKEPSKARVKELSRAMSGPSIALYHDLVDEAVPLHAMFERAQREALAAHLNEPFEPIEGSWVANQLIEYHLNDVGVRPEQRLVVEGLKKEYLFKLNVMRRQGTRDRQMIMAEMVREEPDVALVHKLIDAMARRWNRFIDQAIEDGEQLVETMTDEQRPRVNAKLDQLRTCPEAKP